MDQVMVEIDSKWAKMARSPLYWIVGALPRKGHILQPPASLNAAGHQAKRRLTTPNQAGKSWDEVRRLDSHR
jgi:hypothetical protein